MDADEALRLCDSILYDLDGLPERAADFADSVREKVESMRDWIEEKDHCTEAQGEALENMRSGVSRWMR